MYAYYNNAPPEVIRPRSCAGLGLFDAGLNFDEWTVSDWIAVALGVYVVASVLGDVGRGRVRVQKTLRRRRARKVAA